MTESFECRKKLFSILMPVYNEYSFVRACICKVLAAPLPDGIERELVIVDDGSKDGTREILSELAEAHSEINLIFHEENQGKGAAIRTAIEAMKGEVAIFQDADLEYDPNEYSKLITPILEGYADVVYGSRFAMSKERRVFFYKHALGNMFLTHLSNLFTDLFLTDMETCYKAFRSAILKTIPIRSNDFGLEPEITAKVSKRDCIVYEVPISYRGRSYAEGKKITWKDGFIALKTIVKYWLIDDCFDERYGHKILLAMSHARRYNKWLAELARPFMGKHVLELGSGIGNMSIRLAGQHHLTVSDYDPVYVEMLGNVFEHREDVGIAKIDVTKDEDFEAVKDKNIDTVVAYNMLEHIEDDGAVLDRIHKLLPYNGTLLLIVPQYQSFFSTFDEEVDHKRRYDKLGLRSLLVKHGFDVEKTKDVNWLGLPGWYINGVLLRRRHFSKIQLKIFDLLVPILKLTSWLPLPGLSILAVARKQ
ncbi:MAG: glycosyltransferase [Planctomycetota bacterium]|jgi:glycosyltransferase involved in cell wall biosynthesis